MQGRVVDLPVQRHVGGCHERKLACRLGLQPLLELVVVLDFAEVVRIVECVQLIRHARLLQQIAKMIIYNGNMARVKRLQSQKHLVCHFCIYLLQMFIEKSCHVTRFLGLADGHLQLLEDFHIRLGAILIRAHRGGGIA
ncbi:hypothetical protein [Brevibacillus centrosporus]|uniref:hypothetical protein n=1 Tax=Brevibacillus centrosporus TaxID=54910 RepID=UPI0011138488|nr:hypothetical protein [Brevibacillus centrosporus]